MDDVAQDPSRGNLARSLALGAGAAGVHESSVPVLDLGVIAELQALTMPGKPGLLGRMVALFLAHSPGLLDGLQQGMARQDCTGLAQAAHEMKSSSGNLGAARLSSLCERLERTARAGLLEAAPELLAALDAAYRETVGALAEFAAR